MVDAAIAARVRAVNPATLAPDEARRAAVERVFGRSHEQLCEWAARLRRFALDRADEARRLMPLVVPPA